MQGIAALSMRRLQPRIALSTGIFDPLRHRHIQLVTGNCVGTRKMLAAILVVEALIKGRRYNKPILGIL